MQTKLLGKGHVESRKPPETVSRDSHPAFSSVNANVPDLPVVLSQDQPRLVSKQSLDNLPQDRISLVNFKNGELPYTQQHVKVTDGTRLEKKLQEKSLKQVQSLKAVCAPKIPVIAKVVVEERNGKRDSSEENEKCRKSRPITTTKTQCQVGEESAEQGKRYCGRY